MLRDLLFTDVRCSLAARRAALLYHITMPHASAQEWNSSRYAQNARFVSDLGQPVLEQRRARIAAILDAVDVVELELFLVSRSIVDQHRSALLAQLGVKTVVRLRARVTARRRARRACSKSRALALSRSNRQAREPSKTMTSSNSFPAAQRPIGHWHICRTARRSRAAHPDST